MNDRELFVLVFGVLMLLATNFIYFCDWILFIGGFVSSMAPKREFEEIERNRKIHKNSIYRKHLWKWNIRFLIVPIVYSASLFILSLLINQAVFAFFGAMFAVLIAYSILIKHENKEKQKVLQSIKEAGKSRDKGEGLGDGST